MIPARVEEVRSRRLHEMIDREMADLVRRIHRRLSEAGINQHPFWEEKIPLITFGNLPTDLSATLFNAIGNDEQVDRLRRRSEWADTLQRGPEYEAFLRDFELAIAQVSSVINHVRNDMIAQDIEDVIDQYDNSEYDEEKTDDGAASDS